MLQTFLNTVGNNGVLKRYFVSYLIVLMIPILMGSYLYSHTVNVVEDGALQANLSILNQNKEIMDQRLEEIDHMVNRFSLLANVRSALNVGLPLSDEDHILFTEMKKDLSAYMTNGFIFDFSVFLKKSETLISVGGGIYHGKEEYERFMKFGDLEYNRWTLLITERFKSLLPPAVLHFEGRQIPSVAYASSLYLGSHAAPDGAIVIYIDQTKLTSMLNHVTGNSGGWAYIADAAGQVLASTDNAALLVEPAEISGPWGSFHKQIDEQNMLVAYTTSAYNGWKYISVIPADSVLSKAVYIKRTTWYISVVTLLVGLLIAVYLSYRNSKPLQELFYSFKTYVTREEGKGQNEYEYMKGALHEIISSKQQLEQMMDDQLPLLKNSFFDKLLRGDFHSFGEMEAFQIQARLKLKTEGFLMLLIKIRGYNGIISPDFLKELHFSKFIVKNLLGDLLGSEIWIHDVSEDTIVVWYGVASSDSEEYRHELQQKFETLDGLLRHKFSIHGTIIASPPYESLNDTWKAYQQTRQTGDYVEESGILWTQELTPTETGYYYPMEVEVKLNNTVLAGESEELNSLLEHIYAENIQKRKLAPSVLHQLLLELKGTLTKVSGHMQTKHGQTPEEWSSKLDQTLHRDFAESYHIITHYLLVFCEEAKMNRNQHNEETMRQMLRFIELEFANPELSLTSLSMHMKLTESYISYFFKQHLQMNFSVYLENKRLDKACELLAHSSQSIQDIAVQVGYSSDRVFRRAFKRVKGIQPTQYRDSFKS
ncbi:AraC family transcriptional regulator [Paenibacillus sp. GD4]|uniref:AraC family transcriptional regulator n=1 Tax=Paenibacillus sp. GD4 TaxID=3068890 RepID=UPI002796AD43|nr:AraC family transcriptional regulator [Paenibacillus sp. GD4]MDQ1914244.1 AraC family transcriptional regulator [Paenibacillus sp. GD4]